MAKTTGNPIHYILENGITIPPVEMFGVKLSNVDAIASGFTFDKLELVLRWRTHAGIIHEHIMPNRELTDDEITAILAIVRIS
jgi:hypothetical protein